MSLNVSSLSERYSFEINGASYAGKPRNNTVMFISKKVSYLIDNLKDVSECLVFLENGINVPEEMKNNICFVFSDNPQLAYAEFTSKMQDERMHEEKKLGYTLTDEGYYVGINVSVGKNAFIEPGALLGHNVKIGDNAIILSGSVIKHAVLGDNVIVNENAVIGASGFTMAEDGAGNKLRIPSLGNVVIGNNVEIGAHDNISCGSAGDTVIGNNVKLDALVHIGHDVCLGDNTEVTAGAIVGGFVETGEHAYIGINAVLRNRIRIGENCFVGMGAVVTKSFPENVTIVGNPAKVFQR